VAKIFLREDADDKGGRDWRKGRIAKYFSAR
jgi:hypothetical protein